MDKFNNDRELEQYRQRLIHKIHKYTHFKNTRGQKNIYNIKLNNYVNKLKSLPGGEIRKLDITTTPNIYKPAKDNEILDFNEKYEIYKLNKKDFDKELLRIQNNNVGKTKGDLGYIDEPTDDKLEHLTKFYNRFLKEIPNLSNPSGPKIIETNLANTNRKLIEKLKVDTLVKYEDLIRTIHTGITSIQFEIGYIFYRKIVLILIDLLKKLLARFSVLERANIGKLKKIQELLNKLKSLNIKEDDLQALLDVLQKRINKVIVDRETKIANDKAIIKTEVDNLRTTINDLIKTPIKGGLIDPDVNKLQENTEINTLITTLQTDKYEYTFTPELSKKLNDILKFSDDVNTYKNTDYSSLNDPNSSFGVEQIALLLNENISTQDAIQMYETFTNMNNYIKEIDNIVTEIGDTHEAIDNELVHDTVVLPYIEITDSAGTKIPYRIKIKTKKEEVLVDDPNTGQKTKVMIQDPDRPNDPSALIPQTILKLARYDSNDPSTDYKPPNPDDNGKLIYEVEPTAAERENISKDTQTIDDAKIKAGLDSRFDPNDPNASQDDRDKYNNALKEKIEEKIKERKNELKVQADKFITQLDAEMQKKAKEAEEAQTTQAAPAEGEAAAETPAEGAPADAAAPEATQIASLESQSSETLGSKALTPEQVDALNKGLAQGGCIKEYIRIRPFLKVLDERSTDLQLKIAGEIYDNTELREFQNRTKMYPNNYCIDFAQVFFPFNVDDETFKILYKEGDNIKSKPIPFKIGFGPENETNRDFKVSKFIDDEIKLAANKITATDLVKEPTKIVDINNKIMKKNYIFSSLATTFKALFKNEVIDINIKNGKFYNGINEITGDDLKNIIPLLRAKVNGMIFNDMNTFIEKIRENKPDHDGYVDKNATDDTQKLVLGEIQKKFADTVNPVSLNPFFTKVGTDKKNSIVMFYGASGSGKTFSSDAIIIDLFKNMETEMNADDTIKYEIRLFSDYLNKLYDYNSKYANNRYICKKDSDIKENKISQFYEYISWKAKQNNIITEPPKGETGTENLHKTILEYLYNGEDEFQNVKNNTIQKKDKTKKDNAELLFKEICIFDAIYRAQIGMRNGKIELTSYKYNISKPYGQFALGSGNNGTLPKAKGEEFNTSTKYFCEGNYLNNDYFTTDITKIVPIEITKDNLNDKYKIIKHKIKLFRGVNDTGLNAESSRSHLIMLVTKKPKNVDESTLTTIKEPGNCFCLIDLAGTEDLNYLYPERVQENLETLTIETNKYKTNDWSNLDDNIFNPKTGIDPINFNMILTNEYINMKIEASTLQYKYKWMEDNEKTDIQKIKNHMDALKIDEIYNIIKVSGYPMEIIESTTKNKIKNFVNYNEINNTNLVQARDKTKLNLDIYNYESKYYSFNFSALSAMFKMMHKESKHINKSLADFRTLLDEIKRQKEENEENDKKALELMKEVEILKADTTPEKQQQALEKTKQANELRKPINIPNSKNIDGKEINSIMVSEVICPIVNSNPNIIIIGAINPRRSDDYNSYKTMTNIASKMLETCDNKAKECK
jgi:hypothetical protein